MADEQVITELVIDARPAEAGSAAYVKAMKAAEAAQAKVVGQQDAVTKAIEKQTAVLTQTATSLTSTSKAWDRLKASVDPAFAATQRMERALLTADAAAKKLGIDQVEINRVMDLAKAKHLATAVAVEEGAQAAKLGATQWASLGHSVRSAAESIAIGASPMQALTQQANHLTYAMSGPQGLIAASAGARAAFAAFLTTPVGALAVAGTAAVAAVAGYMLATREDIKSVDEILQGHKALLDEVANTYPHLTEALKKYADEAAKLPGSVIAADAAKQIRDDQSALSASLDHFMVDLRTLAAAPDVVGTAGAEAFGRLADTIAAGNVDVDKLVASVGDLRLDPSLTPDAQHFADGLQGAANEAKKLQDTLTKDQGIKSIGPDGNKATQTLAEVAAGFKDVSAKAGGADVTIAKLFGDASASGGFGVSKSLQSTLGQFEQIDQAVQQARQNQLQSFLGLEQQFRNTTTQVETLKAAIATAGGKENIDAFFGDVTKIKDANSEITNATATVTKLFDALNSGGTSVQNVAAGLDMVRQTLVQDGFGVDAVNKFIDSLVRTRMQLDADVTGAKQLNSAIQAIQNKTVTVTVVTRQVGSGTQSTYDVGSTGGIGVTCYGGTSNMTQQAYSVPSNGYGSQGGYGNGGTSTVGVTRFSSTGPWENPYGATANEWSKLSSQNKEDIYNGKTDYAHILYPDYYRASGGPISPGSPYWVGEKGPELVVPTGAATVIPNAQSLALANPQSAFTGRQATVEQDRIWTVLMNIEANTRKTYAALDDMKAGGTFSGGGSSSSGGASSGRSSQTDPLTAQYMDVLKSVKANFAAAGIVGRGVTGYGVQGLNASPEEIARALVYGGKSSAGSAGATSYEISSAQSDAYAKASVFRRNPMSYFETGGMIEPGGRNGDTQKVEFFKSPKERVIIANPEQFEDRRGGGSSSSGGDRPIQISMPITVQGGATVTKESTAELRRQVAAAVRDGLRSVNGR